MFGIRAFAEARREASIPDYSNAASTTPRFSFTRSIGAVLHQNINLARNRIAAEKSI
jgi:hypothetical protein